MKKKIRKLVLAAAFCGFLAFFLPIAGAALSRKPSLDSETHSINTGQINRPESSMSISESPSGQDIEAEEVDLYLTVISCPVCSIYSTGIRFFRCINIDERILVAEGFLSII